MHDTKKPAAKFEPLRKKPKRRFGVLKGKIKIAKDFDAPLPDEILSLFYRPRAAIAAVLGE